MAVTSQLQQRMVSCGMIWVFGEILFQFLAKDTIEEIHLNPDNYFSDYPLYYRNIAAVLDGTEELRVRPEETMRVMRIMEAAFESSEKGIVVNFE